MGVLEVRRYVDKREISSTQDIWRGNMSNRGLQIRSVERQNAVDIPRISWLHDYRVLLLRTAIVEVVSVNIQKQSMHLLNNVRRAKFVTCQ